MHHLRSLSSLTSCVAAGALLVAVPPPLPEHQHRPAYGIVVMAHGGDQAWNQRIADAVADTGVDVPVSIAFGMADRASLEESVAVLENEGVRNIVVVRLFVSGESFLEQTEYLLGLDDVVPRVLFDGSRGDGMRPAPDPEEVPPIAHGSAISISTAGLVDAEVSGRIVAERALSLSRDPAAETVLVIAHGMGEEQQNERLLAALQARAATIRAAAPFRAVAVATLREDWGEKRAASEEHIRDIAARATAQGRLIVIPFRVAGFGPYGDVLAGFDFTADGVGLLPHAGITSWIQRTARRLACAEGWGDECSPPAEQSRHSMATRRDDGAQLRARRGDRAHFAVSRDDGRDN